MPSGTRVVRGEVSLIDNAQKYTTSSLQNCPIDRNTPGQAEPGAVLADVKFEARRTFYRRNLMRVVESRPSVGIPTIAALPWTRSAPDNAIRPRFRRMLVPGTSRRNTHRTGTNLRPCHRRTGTIQHHSKVGASRLDSVRIPSTPRELRATGDRCCAGCRPGECVDLALRVVPGIEDRNKGVVELVGHAARQQRCRF
jgi:hypothetical protein